jgi:hypothetical protein
LFLAGEENVFNCCNSDDSGDDNYDDSDSNDNDSCDNDDCDDIYDYYDGDDYYYDGDDYIDSDDDDNDYTDSDADADADSYNDQYIYIQYVRGNKVPFLCIVMMITVILTIIMMRNICLSFLLSTCSSCIFNTIGATRIFSNAL